MLKIIDEEILYNGYIHLQSYEPESVLDLVDPNAGSIEVDIKGTLHLIRIDSLRLQCFKRSRRCTRCGLEGTIISADTFTSRSDRDSTHFNLYAIFEGKARLMTKDHIMPKSKGGANHLDNLQTMCDQCNNRKGSKILSLPHSNNGIIKTVAPFGDKLNISNRILKSSNGT